MLSGKRILLIISGGIAAYKSLDLIRRLRERNATVRCVLTRAGAEFVTPLSVAALSEETVYGDLFSLTDENEMGHIRLSREADLVVIAPATANILAKLAGGIADDLATTALLATDKTVIVYPNMGEQYHAAQKTWSGPSVPIDWAAASAEWARLGAAGIGGCCRVRPEDISKMRRQLVP